MLEEKTADKPEKLSTDFYTFKKQQITRLDAKDSREITDEIDEALLDEIKDLLKE